MADDIEERERFLCITYDGGLSQVARTPYASQPTAKDFFTLFGQVIEAWAKSLPKPWLACKLFFRQ